MDYLNFDGWRTYAEELAANTGECLGDLEDIELSALVRISSALLAAAQREILARRDEEALVNVPAATPAAPYPADWSPPPFRLGQFAYLYDSGNIRVQIVGLVHNGRAGDDYWQIYTIDEPRRLSADCYREGHLSAAPLIEDDDDYQDYLERGGTLDWTAWRALMDRYEQLLPTMWQTPTPPEPSELTTVKRQLLID